MPKTKLFSVTPKDCRVEAIASTSGNGGQNRNRRHTAIRITHEPSGAVGYSADERDQPRNKAKAWRKLGESKEFQAWARLEAARLSGRPTIESQVEEAMQSYNLRVEQRTSEGWVPFAD